MRCFEVELNGERYCLAGVGDREKVSDPWTPVT
jgi:hypothetical protein